MPIKRALVISAIVMFAVIMGMSAMAPAMADRPVDPVWGGPPTATEDACDDLDEFLDRLIARGAIDEDDKAAALAAAGCTE